MRRAAVIPVVVIAVFALLGIGHAADLQAGWYANIRSIDVYTYGDWGPELTTSGYFYDTPPGDHGLFEVTDGPSHADWQRYVSVRSNVSGVGPANSLLLPVHIGLDQGTLLAGLSISWQTNYDPSQMRLELWRTTSDGAQQLVWTQLQGGLRSGGGGVAFDTCLEGPFYFKVSVLDTVPEPSTLVCLFAGVLPLLRRMRSGR